MINKNIIAFSGRARSGKTELCNALVRQNNAKKMSIAFYLKKLCCEILNISYNELNDLKNKRTMLNIMPDKNWSNIIARKTNIEQNIIQKYLNNIIIKDIRHMLQFIGTNIIRKYKVNWHINNLIYDIKNDSTHNLFVIDDVRFQNEKTAIENINGQCFFIVRPDNIANVSNHASEISIQWKDFPYKNIIINDTQKNIFINKFIKAYRTSFNKLNVLFLSENQKYLMMNLNYGLYYNNQKLFNIIKDHIFTNPLEQWIYINHDMVEDFKTEVVKNNIILNNNKYFFYNPIIIENFKLYKN